MEEIKLESGEYLVLDDAKDDEGNIYILAVKSMRGVSLEYVTWLKNDRGLTLGHYFPKLKSAIKDLEKRVN